MGRGGGSGIGPRSIRSDQGSLRDEDVSTHLVGRRAGIAQASIRIRDRRGIEQGSIRIDRGRIRDRSAKDDPQSVAVSISMHMTAARLAGGRFVG